MLFFTISIRQIARLGLFYKTQNSVGTFVIDFKTKTVELQGFSIQVGIWVKANKIPQKNPVSANPSDIYEKFSPFFQ